jgi:hypothetical protein
MKFNIKTDLLMRWILPKQSKDSSTDEETFKNFIFVTNIKFTQINAFKIVAARRSRRKIEN